MTQRTSFATIAFAVLSAVLGQAQDGGGLDPAAIRKPLAESWPVYSGDYTGRRYSALAQVNQTTVRHLSLAWVSRLTAGSGAGVPAAGGGRGGGGGLRMTVGGEGTGEFATGGAPNVKGSILMANDVLYVTAPDNVWAVDARDGRVIWQYYWKTKGGTHIGNRGAALWHNYLFFETPDNYLVSLDARTGKERWHVEIADFDQQYFSTAAPVVIDNHVLVGTGNDLDSPGFLQSYDPETGQLQWKFYTVPMNPGDPGLETWPNLDAARHGGGQVWIPGSYDPETRLYIFGTGNPTPGYTGASRPGDNLFTCSLVAVHVDTGKMAWYFQTSAHDTHDWDSAQTPILIDGTINGQPRKLVSTAARNGYFYTLDRVTGAHIVTSKYGSYSNWDKEMRPNGVISPNPAKEATVPGSLVSPVEGGVTNWPPAAYSPDTGLFYVTENNGFNMLYLTDPDPRGSMGLGGKTVYGLGSLGDFLTAIDYKTGRVAWRHPFPGGGSGGLLTTAGGLIFAGDGSGNFGAFSASDGKPLWHSRIGNPSNASQTYLVDGRQYVLVAVGDVLYAFVLNSAPGTPAAADATTLPKGPRVYVTNERSGDLTVIDVQTNEAIATIPLGKRPRGIRLAPDGTTLYIALSGSPIAAPGVDEKTLPAPDRSADGIGVFDTIQMKLVKVIHAGTDPEQLAVSRDGKQLFVANEDAATASIVDVASGSIVGVVSVGGEPEGVERTPDGALVYVTSEEDNKVFVIDPAKGKVVAQVKTSPRPRSTGFLPDGSRAYVTSETGNAVDVLDARSHRVLTTIKLDHEMLRPMGIEVAPDGSRIYVTLGRGKNVAIIDTKTNAVASMIEVGERPWGIAMSPDGRTLYTANGPSNDVSVVDIATQKVVARVKAGDSPWGAVFVP